MNESQNNLNRLTTPAAVKLELISEIQASLNAINGEESFWLQHSKGNETLPCN